SSSGKSTFAQKHFLPSEVLSSDQCRAWVCDNENSLSATKDAFEILHFIAAKRLENQRLTVIDATNVQADARTKILRLAREYHCLPVAIALNLPEKECQKRNKTRTDRHLKERVIRNQAQQMRRSIRQLKKEGFRYVYTLNSLEEIEQVEIERQRLWSDRREECGPFDIIGDIHGCSEELHQLLEQLGYVCQDQEGHGTFAHPNHRKAVFVGDLVDRGPDTPGVLKTVMRMVEAQTALCVPGNHDIKLLKKLQGKRVQMRHGLAESWAQMAQEDASFALIVKDFLQSLVSHVVLDQGRLVVAHAGMREDLQGRASGAVRQFALYGETTGETDEWGLPIRYQWAAEYRGRAMVVYGHTPVASPEWLNNTVCIDTGCVFGGKLTALRYPERETVQVDAQREYCTPVRPLIREHNPQSLQQEHDLLLDIDDVLGNTVLSTRLGPPCTIREENATSAFETLSRFGVDPRWLIYLPPTMSPAETSPRESFLEHPEECFAYYRKKGLDTVLCEEKHLGSRAILIVCRSLEAAHRRFGIQSARPGVCYTRTGRPFFKDPETEAEVLRLTQETLEALGWWDTFDTNWFCFDGELMPWSAKAQSLLTQQYAPVGYAAQSSLRALEQALQQSLDRGLPMESLHQQTQERMTLLTRYQEVYRSYC
ncbi:MAG: polynucleotide kinase-phosphatase, partial [Myxococcota bacterium]